MFYSSTNASCKRLHHSPTTGSITCILQGSVATYLSEVAKTRVICVKFLLDVACQKLLKLVSVSRSYTKNKSGTFFTDHGVVLTAHHVVLQPKDIQHALSEVIIQKTAVVEDWSSKAMAGAYPLDESSKPVFGNDVAKTTKDEDALNEDFFIDRPQRSALPAQTMVDQTTAAACLGFPFGKKRKQPTSTSSEDIFQMDADLIVAHNLDMSGELADNGKAEISKRRRAADHASGSNGLFLIPAAKINDWLIHFRLSLLG